MRLAITVVVSVLLMGLTASGVGSQEAAAEHGGWDREGAAKYLDERMDAWFANAKKLRTGAFWHWRTRRPSDRKSTRLNSSHVSISYAVFCLKKKKKKKQNSTNKTE